MPFCPFSAIYLVIPLTEEEGWKLIVGSAFTKRFITVSRVIFNPAYVGCFGTGVGDGLIVTTVLLIVIPLSFFSDSVEDVGLFTARTIKITNNAKVTPVNTRLAFFLPMFLLKSPLNAAGAINPIIRHTIEHIMRKKVITPSIAIIFNLVIL